MLSYTLKEGHFRSNFDEDRLKEAIEKSFSKEEKRKVLDEMIDEIDDKMRTLLYSKYDIDQDAIKHLIIKYMLKKDLRINRNTLISNINYYIQFSNYLDENSKIIFFSNIIN